MTTSKTRNQTAGSTQVRRKAAVRQPAEDQASSATGDGAAASVRKIVKTSPASAGKAKAATKAGEQRAKKEPVEKRKKLKLIRDSFAMPVAEYDQIAALKKRCLAKGIVVKKSEVLRAAIASFATLNDTALGSAFAGLQPIKTGRPPKHAK